MLHLEKACWLWYQKKKPSYSKSILRGFLSAVLVGKQDEIVIMDGLKPEVEWLQPEGMSDKSLVRSGGVKSRQRVMTR